jgi:hypothetical protein
MMVVDMKTLEQLIEAAQKDADTISVANGYRVRQDHGYAAEGRFAVRVVPCARPSVGLAGGVWNQRLDFYLGGKRVKRSVLAEAMEGARA